MPAENTEETVFRLLLRDDGHVDILRLQLQLRTSTGDAGDDAIVGLGAWNGPVGTLPVVAKNESVLLLEATSWLSHGFYVSDATPTTAAGAHIVPSESRAF